MRLQYVTKKFETQNFLKTYSTIQFSESSFCGHLDVCENLLLFFGSKHYKPGRVRIVEMKKF